MFLPKEFLWVSTQREKILFCLDEIHGVCSGKSRSKLQRMNYLLYFITDLKLYFFPSLTIYFYGFIFYYQSPLTR